jgi:S1-C subfamily serine protease
MTKKSLIASVIIAGCLAAWAPAPAASTGPVIDDKKVEEIIKAVSPSVVRVEARNGVHKVATGVVIDKDGSIVTTALISPRDEEITVFAADGRSHKAEFKGFDTQTGIAVVQVKGAGLEPIVLGKSGDVRPGAWVGVVGLSPEKTPAITQGIVSSTAADKIRLNVWVVPGSSGSPVVNGEGRMIGLLRGPYMDEQPLFFEFREQQIVGSGTVFSRAEAPSAGMALAVPIDVVDSVATDIRKNGKVLRGWLGVSAGEEDGKVVIAEVYEKSPAELAKLQEGDVIVKVGEKDIAPGEALMQEIRARKPGTDVTLRIERDGKPMDVRVKLGEYSEEDARRELEINFPGLFRRELKTLPWPEPTKPGQIRPKKTPMPIEPKVFSFFNRKYIGVSLQPLTKDLATYFGVKDGTGLLVAEVNDDSPAEKAGIKVGDVILKADGKAIGEVDELSDTIQGKKSGDKIKLEIIRDRKSLAVEVEIKDEEGGDEALSWFWPGGAFDLPKISEDSLKKAQEETRRAYESLLRSWEGKSKDVRKKTQDLLDREDLGSQNLLKMMTRKGVFYRI